MCVYGRLREGENFIVPQLTLFLLFFSLLVIMTSQLGAEKYVFVYHSLHVFIMLYA